MSATTIFVIGIVAAAGLAALAVFAVAWRRGPSAEPITAAATGRLDKRAVRSDRKRQASAPATGGGTAVATLTATDEEDAAPSTDSETTGQTTAPPPDPALQKIPITADEYGVSRRKFLNRALFILFVGAFMGLGLAGSFLAFLWPKLKGGFGSAVNAGNFNDIQSQLIQPDGSIQPMFMAAAQSWIVPFDSDVQDASSFAGLPVVATDGSEPGLMALWQRCVHLGCRVPECLSSQGFECPCHGSKYNFHGEYVDGPAPRNMDRFAVEVNDNGDLIIQTGQIVETSRATTKTIPYPQGPSCL